MQCSEESTLVRPSSHPEPNLLAGMPGKGKLIRIISAGAPGPERWAAKLASCPFAILPAELKIVGAPTILWSDFCRSFGISAACQTTSRGSSPSQSTCAGLLRSRRAPGRKRRISLRSADASVQVIVSRWPCYCPEPERRPHIRRTTLPQPCVNGMQASEQALRPPHPGLLFPFCFQLQSCQLESWLRRTAPLRPLSTQTHQDPTAGRRPECENTCGTPCSEEHPQGIRGTAMLQLDPARILSPCCASFPRTCF